MRNIGRLRCMANIARNDYILNFNSSIPFSLPFWCRYPPNIGAFHDVGGHPTTFHQHDVEKDKARQHSMCGFGCDVKTNEEIKQRRCLWQWMLLNNHLLLMCKSPQGSALHWKLQWHAWVPLELTPYTVYKRFNEKINVYLRTIVRYWTREFILNISFQREKCHHYI